MARKKADKFAASSRRLTLRPAHKAWKAQKLKPKQFERRSATGELLDVHDDDSGLQPGFEQLYSFYAPRLTAKPKPYTISVNQHVQAKTGPALPLTSSQDFNIDAPQYTLPDSEIHIIYPPQGNAAPSNILPHVVLNNPHLPWERQGSVKDTDTRNMVPWMALLSFTRDELTLPAAQLKGSARIFPVDVDQTITLAVSLTMAQFFDATLQSQVITPIAQPSTLDDTIAIDFIFVPTDLFIKHITTYQADGTPDSAQTYPDVDRYKFLAHTRTVNTTGMADAGINDDGIFSVVVSHRTGPWAIASPVPLLAHLISIEGVDLNLPWPLPSKLYVAVCSLYSWTFQSLPPQSTDIADAFTELGETMAPLSVPTAMYQPLLNSNEAVNQRVGKRLQDGYTLTRYRVQTGEETVAMFRGPFTPTITQHPIGDALNYQSTFPTDLQIIDKELGIMDISYSCAWQLGKTLGIADQPFAAALNRIRQKIQSTALDDCRSQILGSQSLTASETVAGLPKALKVLKNLPQKKTIMPVKRWHSSAPSDEPDLSFWSPAIQAIYLQNAITVATALSKSTDGNLYNEQNTPVSHDWAILLSWILDKMCLIGIPAHFFINEPAMLPLESLRFFNIDGNWVDALIDGALSLANHIEQDNDMTRTAIKTAINAYLAATDPVLQFQPQVPTFGFLLRSDIVKQFPDLVVDAPRASGDPKAAILRQENIDSSTMLVLFDRVLGGSDFESLTLSQPSHQQRFAAAANVGPNPPITQSSPIVFDLHYRRIYTVYPPGEDASLECGNPYMWTEGVVSAPPVFDFDSRLLYVSSFAQNVLQNLKANMTAGKFTDNAATAVMMGIQLNDPMYQLLVGKAITPNPPSDTDAFQFTMLKCRDSMEMGAKYSKFRSSWTQRLGASTSSQEFHSPHKASPALIHQLSPHHPPIKELSTVRLTNPKPILLVPNNSFASHPKWIYQVYPLGDSLGVPIPTQAPIPQDLVFSVILPEDQRDLGDFELQELRIKVPVGDASSTGSVNLTESYVGPGPTMLSNLRFNVMMRYQQGTQNYILLKVIPRSTTGSIATQNIDEASFIWPLVDINPYTATGLSVEFTVEEHYTVRASDNPLIANFSAQLDPTRSS
jgi:hypothetical protein